MAGAHAHLEADVVVVGGSIAGCTAAQLLGRAGLRVLVLEAHRDPRTYKRLCTHYVQSSALPVMRRLGLDVALEEAGAVPSRGDLWTTYGWVRHVEPAAGAPPHGYSARRSTLDPLVRRMAADTPGVRVLLGAKVGELLRDGRQVVGARASTAEGPLDVRARLVVGADGRASTVARLAHLPATASPNGRFTYFAHYRGVGLTDPATARFFLKPSGDVSYAFPNDDGVTVLAAFPLEQRLGAFRAAGLERSLLSSFAGLPEAPDLSRAVRVSDVLGTIDHPSTSRSRITAPGVALVGDAALTGDPLWGVGCGWAFQSAAWLADRTAAELRSGRAPERGLRAYAREHRRRLGPHQEALVDFSSGRALDAVERLVFSAAVHDEQVARRFWAFATRNAAPSSLLSPALLARAALVRRHHRARDRA